MQNLLLGAHVSAAGGVPEAPPRAGAIDATAMQLFTKMANRWAERECADEECASFRERLAAAGVTARRRWRTTRISSISPAPIRCCARGRSSRSRPSCGGAPRSGCTYLVSHPGNYMDEREPASRATPKRSPKRFAAAPGDTILCLETTAGSGTALGATFEELAAIISRIDPAYQARVGICVDTCHVYSAGYDLVQDYDDVMARLDDALGLDRLRVMHLNDSKTPFDSHRDRHELIAEGSLGEIPFRRDHDRRAACARAQGDRDAEAGRSHGDGQQNARAAAGLRCVDLSSRRSERQLSECRRS